MTRFTKVYKAPGYPVDPKKEQERIHSRKWQWVEIDHHVNGLETTMAAKDISNINWAEVRSLRQQAEQLIAKAAGGIAFID